MAVEGEEAEGGGGGVGRLRGEEGCDGEPKGGRRDGRAWREEIH